MGRLGIAGEYQHPVASRFVGESRHESLEDETSGVARVIGLIELVGFVDEQDSAFGFLDSFEGFFGFGAVILPKEGGSFANDNVSG